MSKLLINDYPIQFSPKLAERIGLNEAIVLQQMHYWLKQSKHTHDGRKWIYNSYPAWCNQFPFWSESTIKRTIKKLEELELVDSGNYNKLKIDRTKWYSINYDQLLKLERPSGQNDTMLSGQNDTTITRDYTETTTETTSHGPNGPTRPSGGKKIKGKEAEDSNSKAKELEDDKELEILIAELEGKGHRNIPSIIMRVQAWMEAGMDIKVVREAYRIAWAKNIKRQGYIDTIIANWMDAGVRTVSDIPKDKPKQTDDNYLDEL